MKTFKWVNKNSGSCIINDGTDMVLTDYRDKFDPIIKFQKELNFMYINLTDKLTKDIIKFKYIS